MKYKLSVRVEPLQHYIHINGAVENVHITHLKQFFINENFNIKSLSTQDGDIEYIFDKTGDRPPFDQISRPVIINAAVEDLSFEYDGFIHDVISGVNQINDGLVELACYAGWFPKIFDLSYNFEYEITLQIPKGYFVIANGITTLSGTTEDCVIYKITSKRSVRDIAIFASSQVICMNRKSDRLGINAYCSEKMKRIAELKMEYILKGYDILTQLYGDNDLIDREINYIYRPFDGWGYHREDVIFMPEQQELDENPSQSAMADYVHIDLHELAHDWWRIASTTRYDWINEGMRHVNTLKPFYSRKSGRLWILEGIFC